MSDDSYLPEPSYTLNLTQDGGGEVHLHLDLAGVDRLIESLSYIKNSLNKNQCEHDHLFTPDWGGSELSNKNTIVADGHSLVHHLKIYGWTEEWAKKHGFKDNNT